MRFPGNRNPKNYFPVRPPASGLMPADEARPPSWYVLGLDQILVDLEVRAPAALVRALGLTPGQSTPLSPEAYEALLARIAAEGLQPRFSPGGTVANTLNNYAVLSGEPGVLLGAMPARVCYGSPAFHYVARTPPAVALDRLRPVDGAIGTAVTFISEGGERTFAVAPGVSNAYRAEDVPEDLVRGATAVLTSLYTLGDPSWPIAGATRRVLEVASEAGVPVAFGLGTARLVEAMRPRVIEVLRDQVTLAAMNDLEAQALTEEPDPFLACEQILEWVDLVVLTLGPEGMIIAGWTDEDHKRPTRHPIRSAAIPEYNAYEFSRLARRADAPRPRKCYTHVHPYKGGPGHLVNTNGAGDAALAAVLHDVAANRYHQSAVPNSPKHRAAVPFLTYSSLSRNARYGNRVAYEVLRRASPRLQTPVGHDDDEDMATTEPPGPAPPPD